MADLYFDPIMCMPFKVDARDASKDRGMLSSVDMTLTTPLYNEDVNGPNGTKHSWITYDS